MQSTVSQADSVKNSVKTRAVFIWRRARSPARRQLAGRGSFPSAQSPLSLSQTTRQRTPTKRTRTGMDATHTDQQPARTNAELRKTLQRSLFRACACCQAERAPVNPARRNFLAGGIAALGLGAAGAAPT